MVWLAFKQLFNLSSLHLVIPYQPSSLYILYFQSTSFLSPIFPFVLAPFPHPLPFPFPLVLIVFSPSSIYTSIPFLTSRVINSYTASPLPRTIQWGDPLLPQFASHLCFCIKYFLPPFPLLPLSPKHTRTHTHTHTHTLTRTQPYSQQRVQGTLYQLSLLTSSSSRSRLAVSSSSNSYLTETISSHRPYLSISSPSGPSIPSL